MTLRPLPANFTRYLLSDIDSALACGLTQQREARL